MKTIEGKVVVLGAQGKEFQVNLVFKSSFFSKINYVLSIKILLEVHLV